VIAGYILRAISVAGAFPAELVPLKTNYLSLTRRALEAKSQSVILLSTGNYQHLELLSEGRNMRYDPYAVNGVSFDTLFQKR
jgi:hypothetical protein